MEYILQPKPDGTKKKTTRLRDFHLAGWAYASKYRWQDTKQRHMKNDALNASLVTCDEPTTMSAQAGVGVVRRPKKTPHKNKLELPLSIVFQTLMRAADIDGRMPGLAVAAVRSLEPVLQVHFVISSKELRQLMTK